MERANGTARWDVRLMPRGNDRRDDSDRDAITRLLSTKNQIKKHLGRFQCYEDSLTHAGLARML
jgi:hypothetical protein